MAGLLLFSLRLLFTIRELNAKVEDVETELLKLAKKLAELENMLTAKENDIKLLQNHYRAIVRQIQGGSFK
jgi:peptidoglycan hydrolase CwlO-like protein